MISEYIHRHREAFTGLRRMFLLAGALIVTIYLASGIYVVQANETGALFRFGAFQRTVGPGIQYRIPWPVDRVIKVKIMEAKRMEAGFSLENLTDVRDEYGVSRPGSPVPYCLTGDKNIVYNRFAVQYRIMDPKSYLLRSRDPERLLRNKGQSVILKTIAGNDVDLLLTTGKRELERTIREDLSEALDEIGLGVSVASVQIKQIQPPREVVDAFKEVITAREERSTAVHDAENYRNRIIPEAKAESSIIIERSKAYRAKRVAEAKGRSGRFLKNLDAYRASPGITKKRLHIEMTEKLLPRVRIYVLAADPSGEPSRLKLVRGYGKEVPKEALPLGQ